jgi:hypothetical protein
MFKILDKVSMSDSVQTSIKRSKDSWNYIYIALGFTLSIEGTIVSMSPLLWPCNVLLYLLLSLVTILIFLESGWFQNKLIGFKIMVEEKFR